MKSLMKRTTVMATLGLAVALLATACGGSNPTTVAPTATPQRTPVPGVEQTATLTASYKVELWTGPALMMMMMSFPIMSAMDQGQPVSRHLEVHIFDRTSGAEVTDVIPAVRITDQATGTSRELADTQETGASQGVSFVTACLISKHREVQAHFGDNIFLPDGNYTVSVVVGNETAILEISL